MEKNKILSCFCTKKKEKSKYSEKEPTPLLFILVLPTS